MKHYTLAASAALTLVLSASQAYALDEAAVMAQMKAMQEQMASMQKQMANLKNELAEAKAEANSAQKTATEAKAKTKPKEPSGSDVKVSLSPGPKFETADGEYSFRVGGFAQLDSAIFQDHIRDHPDGTTARRARLNVSGNITKDWKYRIENDFANNASTLTDAYLEYAGLDPVTIMVGQFKEPFSLETLTSDLYTSFIERASLVTFSPDRRIGVQVSTYGDPVTSPIGAWTATAGFFGAGTGTASTDDESKDFTGRLTWAPWSDKVETLHFGVAGSHRIPDSASDTMRFSSRAENNLQSSLSVDTGNISRVDHVTQLGLEAAAVYGPFSLQGEYVLADVSREGALADPVYSGYYVEASYFVTGESRTYLPKQGKFDRTRPAWAFNPAEGNWGALQLMARYSVLDLNDSGVNGGELRDLTLGAKWYPHAHVAFMANYIRADTDSRSVTPNDSPDIWVARAQFDF